MSNVVPTQEQSCALCGTDKSEEICITQDFCYETCENDFAYVRCSSCGHVYLRNRPTLDSLDVIYPNTYLTYGYEEHLGRFINDLRNRVQRAKVRPLAKFARPGDAVLDVGCGGGDFLSLVRRFGDASWHLYGVDFSPRAAESLRARGLEVVQERFEELDWQGRPVGAIVMNQLIEHVEDPIASVRKAAQILRPGGVLIMETPSLEGWDARLFRRRFWGGWHAPRHWNLFTAASLTRCVEQAGLEVAEITYLMSPFTWLHSIQYFLRDRLGWRTLGRWIDVDNFLPLCGAAAFDVLQLSVSRRTANMRFVARKPA